MVYDKSKEELLYALSSQKTISVDKLNRLLQNMNISIKNPPKSNKVSYLKGELKKVNKENAKLRSKIRRIKKESFSKRY